MDKCPYCGSETRPGDNFCLSCGHRLTPSTPPSDATIPAQDDWRATIQAVGASPTPNWEPNAQTVAATSPESPTIRSENNVIVSTPAVATPVIEPVTRPGRLILRSDTGEVVREYPLEKLEIAIGRAPNSDILLSKDKLTSRRHATVTFEGGKYILHDERSANGTFVNGQQIEDTYTLSDGDLIGIGEHELIFHAYQDIGEMKTIFSQSETVVSDLTYGTQDYGNATGLGQNGFETVQEASEVSVSSMVESDAEQVSSSSYSVESTSEEVGSTPVIMSTPQVTANGQSGALSLPADGGVTFSRLTSLPQPTLPDIAPLMAALATLDGQVTSLQEQLNATQDAVRNHEADIAQTRNQLRAGVRRVADRMDSTIADVARSREALAWAELIQLMEDVMNNPRDIEYVTKLARKARELNKVFQIHQNVLSTLAECNSLLRSLIGDSK